tara:strand:- start:64 stop:384 length:321 start_codon:yes stop_codon:yes gene_type:complete
MFPENVKTYLVKYTIYDGEHEYGDQVLRQLDPDKIYYQEGKVECIDDAYVLNQIMYLEEQDDLMVEYDNSSTLYEMSNSGDYRLYELHSVKEIAEEDIKILNKYGV